MILLYVLGPVKCKQTWAHQFPSSAFYCFNSLEKASTCAPASRIIDWFSFSAGKLMSGNLFWGGRGVVWVVESPELLHYLRFAHPEWNSPLPAAVPPNVQGCGDSWRKKKKEEWWNRNAATPPARVWLRFLFVKNRPCTFPGIQPKICPPWLPKNSPAHFAFQ